MRVWILLGLGLSLCACRSREAPQPAAAAATYVDAQSCRPCHAEIAESYGKVAMGRSLYRPAAGNVIEDYARSNYFFHRPSNRHYRMLQRDGKFFQRRYQLDAQGREVHVFEQEVTYIIGSGNHARSYLNVSSAGEITELPITWYTQEKRWGMSPSFDHPKQLDFNRQIDYACMSCHNAVLNLPPGADRFGTPARFPLQLPEGIDCQRCHGPGSRHVEVATAGRGVEEVRAAIVNPRRLDPERQMDVCQQCHLEITSDKISEAVRRFGRSAYSFRPGERLNDFLIHFDHAPGTGHEDKFEIAGAAYRLRQSACFEKSAGKLTCITCHNPHRTPRGEEAVAQFRSACIGCHAQAPPAHPNYATSNCITCHMPRRRTEDVVHVVMTDHRIQRRKPARDLLAPLSENHASYRGEMVFYNPPPLSPLERDLYLGMAYVTGEADLPRGIALLEKRLDASTPVEVYIALGGGYLASNNPSSAAESYRKALALDPRLPKVRYNYALALELAGNTKEALEQYRQSVQESPDLFEARNNLGNLLVRLGTPGPAIEHFQAAIRARPVGGEAHNNLSNVYAIMGRLPEARAEIDEALRAEPGLADARNNLGKLLGTENRLDAAIEEFRRAAQLDPNHWQAHYNLGIALAATGRSAAAIAEFQTTLRLRPDFTDARRKLDALR